MQFRPLFTCAILSAGALFSSAQAQPSAAAPETSQMSGMSMPMHATPAHANTPASRAFRAADTKMMKGMSAPYTGDTDQDFVAHMIPHHQGAVEMAEIQLKYGKDPVLRKLAHDIVRAQHEEIALMRRWQATHPQ